MGIFNKKAKNSYAISLDIGTEFVKTVIFEQVKGVAEVVGAARVRQKLSDMQGGGITDIHGVAINCEKAIEEAAQMAGVLPNKVIVGIAGELVKGKTTVVKVNRANPTAQIAMAELQDLVNQVQKDAFHQARAELVSETGQEELDVQLVNAAIVSVVIDGYKVSNPMSYQGKELSVGVYNAFAPIVQLGALETVVRELGLELIAISAEPYAVARCLSEESTDFAAIFIDIGGGTTDVAVVRNGGVEGTKMYAIGGRAFTKRVASVMGENFNKAEDIKLDYSAGKLNPEENELIKKALENDVNVWLSGLQITLEEFGETDLLPSRILLCGGGSNLPEIKKALLEQGWYEDLPFARQPDVHFIKPEDVANIVDKTETLKDTADVTPLALANVALDLIDDRGMLDSMVKKAFEGISK